MNLQTLFNDFIGSNGTTPPAEKTPGGVGNALGKLGENIPGGLAGGAAAGGLMALLMTNKSARKLAGKAAGYGGSALLGGLAYKAYSNWQHNKGHHANAFDVPVEMTPDQALGGASGAMAAPDFQLQLIKAMIAAAKADGHIDATEQQRIFQAVQDMDLSTEVKGMIFDLMQANITVEELVRGIDSIEEKSQIYLASLLVGDPEHPMEKAHLHQLAAMLELPEGLPDQLQWQTKQAIEMAG